MSDEGKPAPAGGTPQHLSPDDLADRVETRKSLNNRRRGQLPKIFWREQDAAERVRYIRAAFRT